MRDQGRRSRGARRCAICNAPPGKRAALGQEGTARLPLLEVAEPGPWSLTEALRLPPAWPGGGRGWLLGGGPARGMVASCAAADARGMRLRVLVLGLAFFATAVTIAVSPYVAGGHPPDRAERVDSSLDR